MSLKKIIALSMIISSGLSLCRGPLKENMLNETKANQTTIKNTLEGATAGALVGGACGCLCPASLLTTTTLCCIAGAFLGATTGPVHIKKR